MYVPDIEPAAASLKDESDVPWKDPAYYFEIKEDGFRCLLHLPPGERMYATGRNRLQKGTGPFAEWALNVLHLQPKCSVSSGLTILDGEILPPPGVPRRALAGVCNVKDPLKAAAWVREHGCPSYNAFDVLLLDGEDIRGLAAIARRRALPGVLARFWTGNPYVGMTEAAQHPHAETFFLGHVSRGGEGVMCKAADAPYGEGWWKVKRKHDVDVFVTGYKEAKEGKTGKFKGLVGALAVSVVDASGQHLEVAHVSGFDDATRHAISADRPGHLNRVLTIRAQELDGKGRLMSPRFKEWRPDLDPRACTKKKMLRDLEAARGAGK